MIQKNILDLAKSFLCWDKYEDLSINLIPIDKATAFYYPPNSKLSTIQLFFEKGTTDFSNCLFLLFHEIGHLEQLKNYQKNKTIDQFSALIQSDKGSQKTEFEREAWEKGKVVLTQFMKKYDLNFSEVFHQFDNYAAACLSSYE